MRTMPINCLTRMVSMATTLSRKSLIVTMAVCMCVSVCLCHFLHFSNILLLPLTKVKSQIDILQKDSLGKNLKRTLVSDLVILAQKLAARKTVFWSLPLICMDSRRNVHGGITELAWTHKRICLGFISTEILIISRSPPEQLGKPWIKQWHFPSVLVNTLSHMADIFLLILNLLYFISTLRCLPFFGWDIPLFAWMGIPPDLLHVQ